MINEKQTMREVFKEARSRLDGITALICMIGGLLIPLGITLFLYVEKRQIIFHFPAFLSPIVTFLLYVRWRQFNSSEGLWSQIINSILISVTFIGLAYVLNFSKGSYQ